MIFRFPSPNRNDASRADNLLRRMRRPLLHGHNLVQADFLAKILKLLTLPAFGSA